ncbi:MAG: NAD-dependent epimerase/dehydratase family protein [Candidatus Aminicenantes bacterium]|nr:NAD-dependent epimerase/dehydratase family protein [Candidatus Aminicenantes bacterium]
MKRVLVTGSRGFIGSNLVLALKRQADIEIFEFDVDFPYSFLLEAINKADFIFHLAGINRPKSISEYETGNAGFTLKLLEEVERANKKPVIVFSSSIQAELENPYGTSKRKAEEILINWARRNDSVAVIYRLPNVFGKWCRPNYNSAVATFCHNIARGLDIEITDPERILRLVYVDDVVQEFIHLLNDQPSSGSYYREVKPVFEIKISSLVDLIKSFKESRKTLILPDFSDPFIKRLYATYVSYLPENEFAYSLTLRSDKRGELAELLKSSTFGQMFISRTRPGEVRGNHYHDSKVEKFMVIEGEALLKFRHILKDEIIQYRISGKEFKIIDIPPGYTHSIENVGHVDLIVLFWADEIFNPEGPDTYYFEVER